MAARRVKRTARSGQGRSARAVGGRGAKALGLNQEMCCRELGGRRGRERRRCGRYKAGKGTERAAHRTGVMLAVLVGLPVGVTMSAEQGQQMPLGVIDL